MRTSVGNSDSNCEVFFKSRSSKMFNKITLF